MRKRIGVLLATFACLAALTGCGGGAGDSGSPAASRAGY